jgi:hypothetical protein
LKQGITEGRFREDLFFRLAVVLLNLPPLRKRGIDFTTLVQKSLIRFAAENGRIDSVWGPRPQSDHPARLARQCARAAEPGATAHDHDGWQLQSSGGQGVE